MPPSPRPRAHDRKVPPRNAGRNRRETRRETRLDFDGRRRDVDAVDATHPGPDAPDATVLSYPDPVDAAASPPELSADERRWVEQINRKVVAGENLDKMLEFLFVSTRGVCPCDRISVSFLENEGRRVVCHWVRAEYEPLLLGKGFAADLEGSSLQPIITTGHPRVIRDLRRYLELHPDSPATRLLVREGVRSSMTAPLAVDGRPVGFLFRSSRLPDAFDERQVRLHFAVAERLGQAVEKAWRIEQLEAANRAYVELMAFVTHELKGPLAAQISLGTTLTEGYVGPLADPQRQTVERMVERARGLLRLVGDYLDLARVEGDGPRAELRDGVDLGREVLDPALETVRPLLAERRVELADRREGPLDGLRGDPTLLQIVLNNLLGNAIKYGNEGGRVELSARRAADHVEVAVWNEGPGFPESEKGRLFRRFSRLPSPELLRRKGSGVGLYVSWRIVRLHGGRIWAESEPGRWARFSFRLPA
jgi:signal transduction histidine kinase